MSGLVICRCIEVELPHAAAPLQTRLRTATTRRQEVMEKLTGVSRRLFGIIASVLILIGPAFLATAAAQGSDFSGPHWVATWSVPPMQDGTAIGASRSFENQTVRQIIYISVGGSRFRVKLSNEYGASTLLIGSAHLALQSSGASIVPQTDRVLTFGGRGSVVIPAGSVALSDPVTLSVPSNTRSSRDNVS